MSEGSLRRRNWLTETGHEPLPISAPAFRLFARSTAVTWISTYLDDEWSRTFLDERWCVERVTSAVLAADRVVSVGDVVIWVGPATLGRRTMTTAFSPALVLGVEPRPRGALRLITIRDTWQGDIDASDLKEAFPDAPWDQLSDSKPVCHPADGELLSSWGLDVWCPVCGDLGRAMLWGLPEYRATRDPQGQLRPWPEGQEVLGGCDPGWYRFTCNRCGHVWGEARLDCEPFWPEDWRAIRSRMITSETELLDMVGCTTWDDLAPYVSDRLDPDVTFDPKHPEADDGWRDGRPSAVSGRVGAGRFWLRYPFTVERFWEVIHGAAGYDFSVDSGLDLCREIEHVEGFPVVVEFRGWGPPFFTRPEDGDGWLPDYGYIRAAPDSWSVAKWLVTRVARVLGSTSAKLEVRLEQYVSDDTGSMTLGELREAHEEGLVYGWFSVPEDDGCWPESAGAGP